MTLTTATERDLERALAAKRKARRAATPRKVIHQRAEPVHPKQRHVRERNNGYLAYLRRQPCRIAGLNGHVCAGRIEAAHLRYTDPKHGRINPGMQRKPDDRWATSLCTAGHYEQHHARVGEQAWWASYGLDGSEVAIAQYEQFRKGGQ